MIFDEKVTVFSGCRIQSYLETDVYVDILVN